MERPIKLLLTLIALLTGLASVPTQARVRGVDAAGVERVEQSCTSVDVAVAKREGESDQHASCGHCLGKPRPVIGTAPNPSIEHGDRALE